MTDPWLDVVGHRPGTLLASATCLFAERGPGAVAAREIARVRAAVGAAMVMGWVILRPFIVRLVDIGDTGEATTQVELNDAVSRVLLAQGSTIGLDTVDPTRSEVQVET